MASSASSSKRTLHQLNFLDKYEDEDDDRGLDFDDDDLSSIDGDEDLVGVEDYDDEDDNAASDGESSDDEDEHVCNKEEDKPSGSNGGQREGVETVEDSAQYWRPGFKKIRTTRRYEVAVEALYKPLGAIKRRFGVNAPLAKAFESARHAVKTANFTNVAQSISAASGDFIPLDQHERAKAVFDKWVEDQGTQPQPVPSEEAAAASEEEFTDNQKNEKKVPPASRPPPFTIPNLDSHLSEWERAVEVYIFMSSGDAPGIKPAVWQGEKVTAQEIRETAALFMKHAEPIMKAVHELREAGRRADTGKVEFWQDQIKRHMDELDGDELDDALSASIYLRVHLDLLRQLVDLYIGRSGFAWMRDLEHMGTILFHPETSKWQYQSAKGANIVYRFRLFTDKSFERHTPRAWRQRAIMEGLCAIYFHTHTKNEAFNRILAESGLASSRIRGANATRCVEQPEKKIGSTYNDVYEIQNAAIFRIKSRMKQYVRAAFVAAATGNGAKYAHAVFLIRGAEDLMHRLYTSLLGAFKLTWTCRAANGFQLPFGLRANKATRDHIERVAQDGKLLIGLKHGSSSSLLNRTVPDDAAFGKLALTARPAHDDDAEWFDLEWDEAPFSLSVRSAWNELVLMAPDLQQRRAKLLEVVAEIISLRLADHDKMPLPARLGFDGLLLLATRRGILRLGGSTVWTVGRVFGRGGIVDAKIRDLWHQCGTNGRKRGVGRYVAARLEVRADTKHPVIDPASSGHYRREWALSIWPPSASSWQPLCYQIYFRQRSAGQHAQAPLLATYEVIDRTSASIDTSAFTGASQAVSSAAAGPSSSKFRAPATAESSSSASSSVPRNPGVTGSALPSVFWPRQLVVSDRSGLYIDARITLTSGDKDPYRGEIGFTRQELEKVLKKRLLGHIHEKLWLEVRAYGKRYAEEVELWVSGDKEKWHRKEDCGVGSANLEVVFRWLQHQRELQEASGYPVPDGVEAAQMRWRVLDEKGNIVDGVLRAVGEEPEAVETEDGRAVVTVKRRKKRVV